MAAVYKIAMYKAKREKLPEVLAVIGELVTATKTNDPGTLRYEAYQEADEVSFVHFMCFVDQAADNTHRTAAHTKKFIRVIYPLCDEEPIFFDLHQIAPTKVDSSTN